MTKLCPRCGSRRVLYTHYDQRIGGTGSTVAGAVISTYTSGPAGALIGSRIGMQVGVIAGPAGIGAGAVHGAIAGAFAGCLAGLRLGICAQALGVRSFTGRVISGTPGTGSADRQTRVGLPVRAQPHVTQITVMTPRLLRVGRYMFRQKFQLSCAIYVRKERMAAAHRWLGCSELSVKDVAARIGYNHVSNFSRAYRTRFGETPARTLRRALTKTL